MAFSAGVPEVPPDVDRTWEGRSLERSLRPARDVVIERSHRIVAAARELADEAGNASFTVAQVARRAGLSIKSVYRCFAGKDEVLLALLEEESRAGAGILASRIDQHRDPVERVRAFVEGIFELLTHPAAEGYAGVLVQQRHRLSDERPDELRAALSPLVDLLARQVVAAAEAGRIEPGDAVRGAETLFDLVLVGLHRVVQGRGDPLAMAAWVWRFGFTGLRGDVA
jgi:AcrR family transcriptional regulator